MTDFQPSSKIYIGNAPFDNSYRHTMTFATKQAQYEYFLSACPQVLREGDYTYVRMNHSIKVPFNAELLYTYDYCMYQNSNYGNKWFYAFITQINYLNENATELVLELDVMQTWYFDYNLVQGFVEREHVNDDTIGAHLNAEPAMDLQYNYHAFSPTRINAGWACFLVTAVPKYEAQGTISPRWGMPGASSFVTNESEPVSGGFYQGQFNACLPLLYKLSDSDSVKTMYRDMEAFNACGAANAIVDAFTLPVGCFSEDPLEGDIEQLSWSTGTYDKRWCLKNDTALMKVPHGIPLPTTIDGYTPKNNKLFVYPYCYLELGDFTGRTEDLQFEFFEKDENNRIWLESVMPANSDGLGFITPQNYLNVENTSSVTNSFKPFTFEYSNKIPWVFSTYQTWMAQNSVANQLAVIGSITSMAISTIPGINAASKALGAGQAKVAGSLFPHLEANPNKSALSAGVENMNKSGLAAGVAGLGAFIGTYERMKRIPNTARGNTAGNSRFQTGNTGWYSATKTITSEYAQIVDDFFSMYGYQIDRVKIPNRTGRRSWNYVKMQNSCHRGSVPASDMDKINSIYDAGITFWHTSDIGNYSLNNDIIS